MASEVPDRFHYSITHTYVARHVGDSTRSATLVNQGVGSLGRFADRPNETTERCEHCEAQLQVVLRSTADVRQRRRLHAVLCPVWALLAVLTGWGFFRVGGAESTLDDGAYLFGFYFNATAALLTGYLTLRSLVLTRCFDTPEVTRTDGKEPYGVHHGWRPPRDRIAPRA
ncbi:hypothetical protein AB0K80_03670 [Streptomyces sp. NPDC052682]|uniref:hypothetical protein n=1 Tax=Streptomyces sp. NPDC052682 TaxID=3154954 RepID=UPI00341DBDB8